jgi:hypothetical protein
MIQTATMTSIKYKIVNDINNSIWMMMVPELKVTCNAIKKPSSIKCDIWFIFRSPYMFRSLLTIIRGLSLCLHQHCSETTAHVLILYTIVSFGTYVYNNYKLVKTLLLKFYKLFKIA